MKTLLGSLLALALVSTASAATTRNDDSCDIAVLPAATLLLPYFEVDLDDPSGETTLVTITNVTNVDQIARVTLWTDRGYPVFTFNVYLTGYDVQALNLYDILGHGRIAPDAGTGTEVTDRRKFSDPNPALDLAGCAQLPGALTEPVVARIRSAFTTGSIDGECDAIGGIHDHAIGYATIDVVGNCSSNTPRDPAYWTTDLRYDNILIGDYQQVLSAQDLAQGGSLVHIRAIPEGGTPRGRRPTDDAGFPRTFYARYQSPTSPKRDARQPLPSQFAARWTEGTSLKIWREGRAGIAASCRDYAADVNLAAADVVVFDEQENGTGIDRRIELAASTMTGVADPLFPQLANGATSGWMYLNLDRSSRDAFASQAWVVSSTRADNRYSGDVDAIALGNGCSAPAERGSRIAPAPNANERHGVASTDNDDSCDIALLPAATLLLPYFEVDLEDPQGETTIFTVTNVSPEDRIARVTLWTDYAFPVITFNIHLTGYDVQSINLYDVIARGLVAPDEGTGTQVTKRGPLSERNFALDLGACARLAGPLPAAYVERMQIAFTEGAVPTLGDAAGCNNVGDEHANAIGYATIDVVRNCATNDPRSAEYWTEDLAWDNVLIGDSHQIHAAENLAQSSTLVHIRAIPEGGTAAERLAVQRKYDAGFPRTFYSLYQPAHAPKLDARQPLPSVFAARWISGGPSRFETWLKIWREGNNAARHCATHDNNRKMVGEIVTFDESENAFGDILESRDAAGGITTEFTLRATSMTPVTYSPWPQTNGAVGGWIWVNLDPYPVGSSWGPSRSTSNWVISSMRAEGRYSVDVDAAALGNGCSPPAGFTEVTVGAEVIGPRP